MNICQYKDEEDDFRFRQHKYVQDEEDGRYVILYKLDYKNPNNLIKVNDYYDRVDFKKKCNIIKDSV